MIAKTLLSSLSVAFLSWASIGSANATVITEVQAKTGSFWGTVTVTNDGANQTLRIWQSAQQTVSSEYVDTGFVVTTDGNGNGSVDIPNVSSGRLLSQHWVSLFGDDGGKDLRYGPAQVDGPKFTSTNNVPGPLPLAGVAVSFYSARKLKNRVRLHNAMMGGADMQLNFRA